MNFHAEFCPPIPMNREITENDKLSESEIKEIKSIFNDFVDEVKKSEDRDYKVRTLCKLGAALNGEKWVD